MNSFDKDLIKAVEIIPQTQLVLQEFLALLADIKPVLLYSIRIEQVEFIKLYFPKLSIVIAERGIEEKKQMYLCSISKKKALALEAMNLYMNCNPRNFIDFQKLGNLLGYPKCCVLNFFNFLNKDFHQNQTLLIYNIYKASKSYSFLTNNVLNFSTHINSNSDWINFDEFIKINFDFWKQVHAPHHYFQFISHIPCRYDCLESIKLGKKIQNLLRKYAPDTEKIVSYTLSKPILFFDFFKLVIFDGYFKDDTLYYQRIIPPFFLIDNLLMEKIKSGNKIIVDNKKIKILKDRSLLFVYQKKNEADGFILNFSED